MKSVAPFDKIQLIKRSLRCFTCGIIGLLPGIGLPFAIVALGDFLQVARHKGTAWNPAERHLGTGVVCATAGLLLTLLLAAVLTIELY